MQKAIGDSEKGLTHKLEKMGKLTDKNIEKLKKDLVKLGNRIPELPKDDIIPGEIDPETG